ncbi:cold shock domain-containing protein [Micromonospora sp. NPDC049559]|uniref:cold-shock protein n=1 Tax=Micromonospora sp. NPDC049559 TaxID=3155923 RepID=UPI0034155F66
MSLGRVLRFDETRGYGFIAPDDGGEDVFVHANTLGEERHLFTPGTPVEYEATASERGLKALSVRISRTAATRTATVPAARDDEDGLCDVLSPSAFRQEVTELFLDTAPSLTGSQIVQLRQALLSLAQRHGWVDG